MEQTPVINQRIIEVTDGTGEQLTICFDQQITISEALAPALRGLVESIEAGHSTSQIPWTDSTRTSVIYARNGENKIVAGIVFEYRPVLREGWVFFSFTEAGYRGRHINLLLRPHMEEILRKRGALRVASHVHVDNQASIKAIERAGLRTAYLRMQKDL